MVLLYSHYNGMLYFINFNDVIYMQLFGRWQLCWHCLFIYLQQRRRPAIARDVCLSICLLARLLKNACVDLDDISPVDRCRDMDELINF